MERSAFTDGSWRLAATLAVAVCALAAPLDAQPGELTLATVLSDTRRNAFRVRMTEAGADAARADARATLATVLPTLRADFGAVRTTDPVAVFGLRLRQRELTAADFDPGALTQPAPRSAVTSGVDLLIPLFAPEQRWVRRAATASARAASATALHSRQLAEGDAARAWLGVIGAREQRRAIDAGLDAARAALSAAQSLLRAGTATRSDVLLAEVRVNELLSVRGAALEQERVARLGLALAMGTPDDTVRVVPSVSVSTDTLLAALITLAATPASSVSSRADVEAARDLRVAADAARSLAARAIVPRLNAMVRSEWNNRTTPFAAAPYTTAGIMLQWTAFGGGAEIGARQASRARAAGAAAASDAAAATAKLEMARAHGALAVAAERLRLTALAATQAAEAERLVRLRYTSGLATVAELLGAAATRTQADVQVAATRLDALTAITSYRLSAGLDLAPLLRLTP